jgi:lipoprotein-anchoring transpeptidase ErfK/SrfK
MKATRIIAFLAAAVLIALSIGMSWAVAEDYVERDKVPDAVTATGVAGQEPVVLTDLTKAEAKAAIQAKIIDPLMQPITIEAGPAGKHTIDPSQFVTVDVDSMVHDALSPWYASSLPERVARKVGNKPIVVTVPIRLKVDEKKLLAWATGFEKKVGKSAVDSTMTVTPYDKLKIHISAAANGHSVPKQQTFRRLLEAMQINRHQVSLRATIIKPTITPANFGKNIVVVREQRRMWLYNGTKLEFTAPIAVGTPGHATPLGDWKIIDKVTNPSWHNPHAAWSSTMPEVIPPGPGNPLGTRALYLDASGIRFHGTENIGSVGTAASHGCMRMYRASIEKLYPMVPIGTKVWIRK